MGPYSTPIDRTQIATTNHDAHLREVEAEMQDMSHRISDWVGVLMQSELLRRKLDELDDAHAK